jgi:RimJ/RimL family protein N-acetyltransferase
MDIRFIPLEEGHLLLLREWLARPHVRAFWTDVLDEAGLREKYLRRLPARSVRPMIIVLDGRPEGYIQSYEACKIGEGWWPGEPPGVHGLDLFLAEEARTGRGVGPQVLRAFTAHLASQGAREAIADPAPGNLRSLRAFEKAGFRREGVIPTPNGPAVVVRRKL